MNSKSTLLAAVFPLALAASGAQAADPSEKPNDSWISVSGTVVSAGPDSFRLDHGSGVITVEMDDFDFYPEGRNLIDNDQVVVYGFIDDDLFEKRTIEASSVYVQNLGTHFYASGADEEDFAVWSLTSPIEVGQVEVTGTVTSVNGRVLTIDNGRRSLRVDTASMPYNPVDQIGYLKIGLGDRIKVSGDMDDSLFGKREIEADWIIELSRSSAREKGAK